MRDLQFCWILRVFNQLSDTGLYERLVAWVGDAKPSAVSLNHRALGLFGLDECIDHGREIAFGLHLIAMRFEEFDEECFKTR